ncbi:MAG: homocysteine S-methyltransferase family protein [Lachnospiraceae bacterium]|nr:homocysteine S-methyltransferase family protein [Lachnospiraceae bacterium]
MTLEQFREYVKDRFVFLDGATGTNLAKAGMPGGVCPEAWILEHPRAMEDLQVAFLDAGTNILYAPTFTANRIKLAEYGLSDMLQEMVSGLVAISKKAIARSGKTDCLVAGDLTMTGQQLRPMGPMDPEALIDVYKEQITALEEAGADLLVVETMMSLAEVRCALIAAKEVSDLPVMVTFTFEPSGRTLFGTDAATAAIVCESLGAAAIGVNCSTGPAAMKGIVESMASVSDLPIIAKPNAGLPKLDAEGKTVYDMSVDAFAGEMQELIAAGAQILGGCCGTTPDFIRALTESCKGRMPVSVPRRPAGMRYLTGERQTLAFSGGDRFIIIGERINPTGKKALQAELREGKMDLVRSFAQEQEACGAKVLDINVGMGGIDEKAAMLTAIEEVTQVTNLPLSLDSSFIDVLEAALRYYPGRALVNSVSLETEKFEKLLPLVAKYGAMFILLPLSDEGLPKDIGEKKQIIEKIYSRALELGMRKEDIVVDGLVQTVGANANAGLETLETIAYATQNGFATVCGLSNISFGMPERKYVNSAFLTLAISKGLSMAISNPSQELLVCTAQATDLLLAKKDADLTYIETVSVLKEKHEKEAQEKARLAALAAAAGNAPAPGTQAEAPAGTKSAFPDGGAATAGGRSAAAEAVYEAVLKGNRGSIAEITKKALDAGEDPQALLNDALIPAINEVGKRFDSGKYFLPQLIGSAEAMKLSIEVLEPLLATDAAEGEKAVVVIATVEGDIHDIGKNLVAMMLKNYGFDVVDLGKDVPCDEILKAAKEKKAAIICLSALMTTTMQRMKDVVEAVKREQLPVKVMVGGAVVTQEYADEIGADGYSRDASEAVKVARKLLGISEA